MMVDSNLLDNMGVLYTKSYPQFKLGCPWMRPKNLWENLWESDVDIDVRHLPSTLCGDDSK